MQLCVISLLIFTAISMYSQSYPHLAATNLIISELCKGERLLHFLNKHTPPPNSTYKCFNYCTLGSTASHLDKDQVTTKKNSIIISEPHVPGPCFGWVLVTVSRVTSDFLHISLMPNYSFHQQQALDRSGTSLYEDLQLGDINSEIKWISRRWRIPRSILL